MSGLRYWASEMSAGNLSVIRHKTAVSNVLNTSVITLFLAKNRFRQNDTFYAEKEFQTDDFCRSIRMTFLFK